jgi:hypothetical protein
MVSTENTTNPNLATFWRWLFYVILGIGLSLYRGWWEDTFWECLSWWVNGNLAVLLEQLAYQVVARIRELFIPKNSQ